jgi:hypothetical protein
MKIDYAYLQADTFLAIQNLPEQLNSQNKPEGFTCHFTRTHSALLLTTELAKWDKILCLLLHSITGSHNNFHHPARVCKH